MSLLTKIPKDHYSAGAFADFKGEREFHLGDGKALAWLCQLAYETDEPEKIIDVLRVWGLAPLGEGIIAAEADTVLPLASTRGIAAVGHGAVFLAFAGTDPLVLANWITDFDLRIATADNVADGFEHAARCAWPQAQAFLDRPEAGAGKRFITGHSLGGALAAVTAFWIAESRGEVDGVYTFGTPRPGISQFANDYNALLGERTYRLVHGEDLVPSVPPSELGFRHIGRYLHCGRRGKFKKDELSSGASSDDPAFIHGASKDVTRFLSDPLSPAATALDRLKIAARLVFGRGPAGMRTDPGGIAIELLPLRLRDHMPDRYIGGF